jgi:uncharacterized membrane protein YfcA
MVPILTLTFVARGYSPDHVIHMALATSMATILPGALASARTHHKLGAVNWRVVRDMSPGILCGTLSGTVFAHYASTAFLKSFFVAFICFLAFQMVFGVRLAAHLAKKGGVARTLHGRLGLAVFGYVMGFVSALAGIGGAVLSILYLTWRNVRMHEAIGTAAAIGLPLALVGTIGFAVTGWLAGDTPQWSVGYVYVPAFLGIAITSFLVAPYGARLAHRLPVDTLKKIFMVFLVGLAVKMAVSV